MATAGTATVDFIGNYSRLMPGLASALPASGLKKQGAKAGLVVGGAFAAAIAGVGIAKGLVDAVNVTKDFEKQMSSLGAVTDANAKQMGRLRSQAIKMGAATVFSASEAAKAQIELAKGGLNTSQILGGALNSSLALAAAGELDLADAAETTVNAMQLFGLQGKATGQIADMLATAANRTTADVLDFAMSLKQGGAVAKTAGYSLNDTVIVLEALAEAGIKNSDAGTSMKASMIQLLNPTKKQADLTKDLGLSFMTANGELKDGIGISKELRAATDDMTKAERTKTFAILAGTDGFRTLSALYDAGAGKLRSYSKANREQGTAAEVAAKKTDNLAGDIEQLSGAWETFQLTVGSKLTPVLRDVTQAAAEAVNEVTKIFDNKNLTNGEKFNKLVQMGSEAALRGLQELAKAAAQAAPDVASAFAQGFVSSPIWLQVATAGIALKMLGGPAGIASAGRTAGLKFGSTFMAAFEIAQVLGASRSESLTAGFQALANQIPRRAAVLGRMLTRAVAPLAASFAIGDILATALSGETKDALVKMGTTLVGGGIGFLVGGPVGAAIGAGIGSALSGAISGLFGGGPAEQTLREQIRESSKRLIQGLKAEVASIANLKQAVGNQVKARGRQKRAAEAAEKAERALNRARKQHGPNSERARAAEARYRIALDNSRKAEDRLRRASRLQGAERRATTRIIRDNVQEAKANIGRLRTERTELQKQRAANLRNNGSLEELRDIQKKLRSNSKQLDDAQGKVNKSIQRAGQVIGPRFAKALEAINTRTATMSRVLPQLSRITESSMSKSRTATQKTSLKFQAFGDVVIDTRKSFGTNMRALPPATRKSMSGIMDSLQENLDAIQNTGKVQRKRSGGLIERIRQSFRSGGVPVAVSPGEMFKTPDGKAGIVPGRPTAADNVLTTMPVGTKVFTFDGQRRLMEGASESEALRSQLPHFAKGGIVKPEIVGGTKKSAEVANAAIGKVYDKASARLKRAKEAAAAIPQGGNWHGGSGKYPGVSGDTDFMPALGNALSAMSKAAGTSIYVNSGWRSYAEQAALYQAYLNGTGNLAAPPGSSNHESGRAADINPGSEVFGGMAGRFGLGFTVPGESWHIELLRRGGIVGLLQALYTGGQVRVVKNVGRKLLNEGFDFRAAAGILGNAYREAYPPWNPASTGTGGGGLWGFTTSPVSLADLQNYAAKRGKDWTDEVLQTTFMLNHGQPTGKALRGPMNALDTIRETATYFMEKWERPGVPALEDRIKGGYEASKILRDAGIVKAGDDGEGGLTPRQERRRERARTKKQRQEWIDKLMSRAMNADSVLAKKGAYWQILESYAKWGDFDPAMIAGGLGGLIGGGEQHEFLRRARDIASIADPNRGAGKLHLLAKWAEKNVEINGLDQENDQLAKMLERAKDRGGKRSERKREKKYKRMARFGENFPWGTRLNKNEKFLEQIRETIQLAEREHTAEWSAGGSEYTDAEVLTEQNLNRKLLGGLDKKLRWLNEAIPWTELTIKDYEKKIRKAQKDPSKRWLIPGYRQGLKAARQTLNGGGGGGQGLRAAMVDILGTTGRGGEWGDTVFKLQELGATTTIEKSAAQGMAISDLTQIIEAAKFGVYDQLPKFHTGGQVPGPRGAEVPVMALGGEHIVPEDRVGGVKVIVHGDIISDRRDPVEVVVGSRRFKAEVQTQIRESARSKGLADRQGLVPA